MGTRHNKHRPLDTKGRCFDISYSGQNRGRFLLLEEGEDHRVPVGPGQPGVPVAEHVDHDAL